MNRNGNLKAFTIIELMVSIFITMIVIASFYKLYDTSAKAERSSAIRVSVNLLGEQMLDTIADSVRFIGLNSKVSDFNTYPSSPSDTAAVNDDTTIIRQAQQGTFQFLSPYGGPITKLKEAVGDSYYPNCTFKIYNSAALNGKINSFYLHTQDGIFETSRMAAGTGYTITYDDYEASFTTENGFESAPKSGLDGKACKDIFPVGTLISGTDRRFTLKYDNGSLYLYAQDKTETGDAEETKTYMVQFKQNEAGQTYAMPYFTVQYLTETKVGTDVERTWKTDAQTYRKDIIAVRFGFVLTSTKDRNKVGTYSGEKNTYCVFGDGSANDCYELSDPNKTAYVFRRIVYLSNHRLLKDTQSN